MEVWSDIACPWCYVGKRRLEAAVARLPEPDSVRLAWRAFELDPLAPRTQPAGTSYAGRLAAKYGTSLEQADAMIAQMTEVAAREGLAVRVDLAQPGNTFDAHRLIHLALERGRQDAVKERFLRGYLCEGEPIGEPEALARLAVEAGLEPKEVSGVLEGDAYAEAVRADEDRARRHGIRAVPFFVLAGRYGISGAQPTEVMLAALTEAFQRKRATVTEETSAEGATCGPDGCG